MKTIFFVNPATLEDLKTQYKELLKNHHPDLHPENSNATIETQQINAEYETLFAILKNTHKSVNGETYTTTEQNTEVAADFMNIINKIITMQGITIELIGCWIWLTGDTKQYKTELKNIGFMWANKKLAWYWHKKEDASHNRKRMTLEQIRNLYGSKVFNQEQKQVLQLA